MTDPGPGRPEAEQYLANPRFHQSVTIDAGQRHGNITISYAEYGLNDVDARPTQDGAPEDDGKTDIPTVLFTPGMFGSRYTGVLMHAFAIKHKVRVLVLDRFGFGKTPDVPVEHRIETWTTVVPRFLEAVKVKHVALASHSAGTIYNLNLLWHCRDILHPKHPMIFFFAPFVDGTCSGAPLVTGLQALPVFSIHQWNKLAKFFVLQASGTIEASSGLLSKLTTALAPGNGEPSQKEKNMKAIERDYGVNYDTQVELESLGSKGMFNENTVGANSEAINCLKRGPEGSWGEAEDIKSLVKRVALRQRETSPADQEKLLVQIYFAESDVMTGKKGQEYFEACWTGVDGEFKDCFDLRVSTIDKSDHDSVFQSIEALAELFETVSKMENI